MNKYLVLLVLIVMQGCSTDEIDTPTPTSLITSFSVFPPDYFINYDKRTYLSGFDNAGNTYKMSIIEKTSAKTTFLGEEAISISRQVEFTNIESGGVSSGTDNLYFSTSASDRHYLGSDGETPTVIASTLAIPQTAKINDAGIVGYYGDNAGNVEETRWFILNGNDGLAKLLYQTTLRDQSGKEISLERQYYTIDESGNRLIMEFEFSDRASGVSVTLSN